MKMIWRIYTNFASTSGEDDFENLPCDPCERKMISEYPSYQRNELGCKYLMKGICHTRGHES